MLHKLGATKLDEPRKKCSLETSKTVCDPAILFWTSGHQKCEENMPIVVSHPVWQP